MSRLAIGITVAFIIALVAAAVSMAQEDPKTDKKASGPEKKQAEEADSLVIEQVCSGFPGTEGNKKKTKQKVVIKGDKIYMQNLETPDVCIVRGDKKLIWEIDTDKKKYRIRKFEYFAEMKANHEKDRKELAKIINGFPNPKERLRHADRNGFLVDEKGMVSAKPVAKTELTGEEKKINGFKCYHLKIYEDTKVVLDVWLTREHKSPDGLMDFYKRLGCFCNEVVAEIKKIKDFPISLKARLVFGALAVPIECEISKVEKKKMDDKFFELPKGFILVKDPPGKEPPPDILTCPVCGKKFNTKENKYVRFRLKNGKTILVCSRKCSRAIGEETPKYGTQEKALEELRKSWEKGKGK